MAKYKEKKEWDKTDKFPKFKILTREERMYKNLMGLCLGRYLLFIKTMDMGKCLRISTDKENQPYGTAIFYIECENGIIKYTPPSDYNVRSTVPVLRLFIDRFNSEEDLDTRKLIYEVTDDYTDVDALVSAFRNVFRGGTIKGLAAFYGLNYLERK